MRELSTTLRSAQQEATGTPYVKVTAKNMMAGIVRLDWDRLYTGSEDDYFHTLTMAGDGAMIRVRVTPPADSRKLYFQRVADPGPDADFSQWTYASEYGVIMAAAAALGDEVSIFWVNSDGEVCHLKSTDYGESFGSSQLIDYSASMAINGIAAAYKPGGDIALFFADQATLYLKERVSNQWLIKSYWDKVTGDLSGVAVVYDGDWNLLISGRDNSGDFKIWSLIYGDGGDVASGEWSTLQEIASAPSDGEFQYNRIFMDKSDVYRACYIEKFSGTEAYSRPFWTYTIPGTGFYENTWREPVPYGLSGDYGLAIVHYGDYCWLSAPYGVWRASLIEESIDLSNDVLVLKEELAQNKGEMEIELRNDDGQYAIPGQDGLSVLDIGCELEFSPGYVTSVGSESSPGQSFVLDAYEHTSAGGKAGLVLYAVDGWSLIRNWSARHQFRWNKESEEMSVRDMLARILGRVGLKLEVKSQSPAITGYYPDFTINPGNSGVLIINKLLSMVPDVLFIEGNRAWLVNPLAADDVMYSYGVTHPILEGKYRRSRWETNRVQVEGYDSEGEAIITVDSFAWNEIERYDDLFSRIEDGNIGTTGEAQQRGEACLRKAEVALAGGYIKVPVNCGQQVFDVVEITDVRAGRKAEKRRVLGLTLVYSTKRGQYEQQLRLGKV